MVKQEITQVFPGIYEQVTRMNRLGLPGEQGG